MFGPYYGDEARELLDDELDDERREQEASDRLADYAPAATGEREPDA